mmetsp:Transcript_36206/g.84903  ORF Transcript_36206/g.84903 Transcript_36206/m.84903 type:complete len:906 (+) Transcript_36206:36-2753(+)
MLQPFSPAVPKERAYVSLPHMVEGEKAADPLLDEEGTTEAEALRELEAELEGDRCEFLWNHRTCSGLHFHRAVLDGDIDAVREMLDERPDLLRKRWVAHAKYQGQDQFYSGTPLHLAASRGGKKVVEELLNRNAQLEETVSRAGLENYDVLHAAVFAEGRGGKPEVVEYLLDCRAELTTNREGRYPLHIAFLTGNREVIEMLRRHRNDLGLTDIEEAEDLVSMESGPLASHGNHPTCVVPLELGIKSGNLSEEEIAEVAVLKPHTLATLIRADPHCVKSWIERLELLESPAMMDTSEQPLLPFRREELVPFIDPEKLAEVIREAPYSADVLLKYMTRTPVMQSRWHAMPRRLSFAPRSISQRIFQMLNPDHYYMTFEEADSEWLFDNKEFRAPDWHEQFVKLKAGRPVKDVEWSVCLIPNLAQALIFQALMDQDDHEASHVLMSNKTVVGLINQVWWKDAWRVDLLTTVLNTWGLALLVADQIMLFELEEALTNDPEQRKHLMAPNFIVAKAVLQLGHEALTFLAFLRMGRAMKFFTVWEMARIIRECISCLLLVDTALYRTARAVVIIVYWGLAARLTYFSESVAKAMLPIMKIVDGLLPSMIFVLIAFCAVAHAFMTFKSGETTARRCLIQVFDTLFTGDIFTGGVLSTHVEGEATELRFMEILLCCGSVMVFSGFFLNLFTGVMCLLYSTARENAMVTHRTSLARNCLHHLLRAERLRGCHIPKLLAGVLIAVGAAPPLAIQIMGYAYGKAPYHSLPIYAFSMFVMFAGAHLCKGSVKAVKSVKLKRTSHAAVSPHEDVHMYLWMIEAKKHGLPKHDGSIGGGGEAPVSPMSMQSKREPGLGSLAWAPNLGTASQANASMYLRGANRTPRGRISRAGSGLVRGGSSGMLPLPSSSTVREGLS